MWADLTSEVVAMFERLSVFVVPDGLYVFCPEEAKTAKQERERRTYRLQRTQERASKRSYHRSPEGRATALAYRERRSELRRAAYAKKKNP